MDSTKAGGRIELAALVDGPRALWDSKSVQQDGAAVFHGVVGGRVKGLALSPSKCSLKSVTPLVIHSQQSAQ